MHFNIGGILCRFRGVPREYLNRHPEELTYLETNSFALAVPVTMATINGWLIADHAGAGPVAAMATAATLGLLIYAVERALLSMIGTAQRPALGVLLRVVLGSCLAVLLGEAVTTGVLFSHEVETVYRREASARMAAAAKDRDDQIAQAEKLRAASLAPCTANVNQKKLALKNANEERDRAQGDVSSAREILLDEEEGRAASGLDKRGQRYREKKDSYLEPALTRASAAESAFHRAEGDLERANQSLQTAVEKWDHQNNDQLTLIQKEYAEKIAGIGRERHNDVGSRMKGIVKLAVENPFIGAGWIVCMIFFVSIDLLALFLKLCGRPAGYDLEERQDHAARIARAEAFEARVGEREQFIVNLESESACRAALIVSTLRECESMIHELRRYHAEVSRLRQPIREQLEAALAHGLTASAEFCRQTLRAIDKWAELGLERVFTASRAGEPLQ